MEEHTFDVICPLDRFTVPEAILDRDYNLSDGRSRARSNRRLDRGLLGLWKPRAFEDGYATEL